MSGETSMPAAAPTAPRMVRPFYWSIRRELWENSSIYLAPLAVAGLGLFGFLLSVRNLPDRVREAAALRAAHFSAPASLPLAKAAGHAHAVIAQSYDFVAGAVFATSVVVAIFYSLGSLYNERRDRSILFWKSLPVSDLTTVLSKAALALIVTPLVTFGVVFAAQVLMLALSSVVLMAGGVSPEVLWDQLAFPFEWVLLLRGLLVMTLWYAPIVAWLMLVSGWARRVAILWALGPWAALCIVELLAFHTTHVWAFLRHRLAGGSAWGFTVGGQGGPEISRYADLSVIPILTNLQFLGDLLGGLVVAVLLLAGAVRMRRYRDPI